MDKPRKRTAEILSACLTIAVCFSGCSVSRNLVFDAVEEKKEQIELDVFGFKYENLNVRRSRTPFTDSWTSIPTSRLPTKG